MDSRCHWNEEQLAVCNVRLESTTVPFVRTSEFIPSVDFIFCSLYRLPKEEMWFGLSLGLASPQEATVILSARKEEREVWLAAQPFYVAPFFKIDVEI